jgi:CRP-like cAMP-binding protein
MSTLGELARHLNAQEEAALLAHMTTRSVPANTTLIVAGEPNDSLFFVERGELLVSLPFDKGPVFVGARGRGSWVGEVTLLDPGPASATVTTAEDTVLRVLSASTLGALTGSHPTVVSHLVRAISEDLAHRIRAAGVVLDDAPTQAPPGFFKGVFKKLFGGAS